MELVGGYRIWWDWGEMREQGARDADNGSCARLASSDPGGMVVTADGGSPSTRTIDAVNLTDFYATIDPGDLAELNLISEQVLSTAAARPLRQLERFADACDIIVTVVGGTRLHLIDANGSAVTLIDIATSPAGLDTITEAASNRTLRIVEVTHDGPRYTIRFACGNHPAGAKTVSLDCSTIDVSLITQL